MTDNLPALPQPLATMKAAKPSKNHIARFNDLINKADKLVAQLDAIRRELDDGKPYYQPYDVIRAETQWKNLQHQAEECATELRQMWPDGNLYHPTKKYITTRIGVMVAAWPDAKLSAPEYYAERMVERLMAEDPSVMALESTFRAIEDTKAKPPPIADVLPLLCEQITVWDKRMAVIEGAENEVIKEWGEELIAARKRQYQKYHDDVCASLEQKGRADVADKVRVGELRADQAFFALQAKNDLRGFVCSNCRTFFDECKYCCPNCKCVNTSVPMPVSLIIARLEHKGLAKLAAEIRAGKRRPDDGLAKLKQLNAAAT